MAKLSVVVPCYNEEKNIQAFYDCALEVFGEISTGYAGTDFELVFVNDGSKDKTLEALYRLENSLENMCIAPPPLESSQKSPSSAPKDSQKIPSKLLAQISLKIINFSRNFGKEAAMYAGLQSSSGDCVAIMDADLQHPPQMLKEMFAKWQAKEAEIIYAKRISRKGDGLVRSKLSEMFYVLSNCISDVHLESGVGDFRLMDREVVNALLAMGEYHRFSKAMFEWVGFRKIGLEYENIPRTEGSSGWGFWKLFKYSIEGFISFSTMPLRVAFVLGFVMSLLSLFYGLYAVVDMLIFHNAVRGWTSLVALIVFLGGVQLIILGIIGEYIARIYEQVKHRPIYIAKKERECSSKDSQNDRI